MGIGSKALTVMDLQSAAMVFVICGVAIAIGVWINQGVGEQFTGTVANNETVNFAASNTYYPLGHQWVTAITKIMNRTVAFPTGAGNITTNYTWYQGEDGTSHIKVGVQDGYSVGNWNVTYSYMDTPEWYAMKNSTKGISTLSQWLPIIAVVVAAAIIIASLMMWFTSRRDGGL